MALALSLFIILMIVVQGLMREKSLKLELRSGKFAIHEKSLEQRSLERSHRHKVSIQIK